MSDTTYQPKVYLKRDAENIVVASGGQVVVESSGQITVESGGEIEGQSGSIIDAQSGFGFYLVNTTYTADKLNNYFTGMGTKTILINSAGVLSTAGGSAPPVLVSTGGTYVFYLDSVASNASARLFSAYSGAYVRLDGRFMTSVASIFIFASGNGFTGVSLVGLRDSVLTSILMAAGTDGDNYPYVDLLCVTDGTWTIVDKSPTGVTEYPT